MLKKETLKKAYEILESRNYERICLVAGICPECGEAVEYTCRNTEKSPVIEMKYICLTCGYVKEEWRLSHNIDKEKSILKFKQKIEELNMEIGGNRIHVSVKDKA